MKWNMAERGDLGAFRIRNRQQLDWQEQTLAVLSAIFFVVEVVAKYIGAGGLGNAVLSAAGFSGLFLLGADAARASRQAGRIVLPSLLLVVLVAMAIRTEWVGGGLHRVPDPYGLLRQLRHFIHVAEIDVAASLGGIFLVGMMIGAALDRPMRTRLILFGATAAIFAVSIVIQDQAMDTLPIIARQNLAAVAQVGRRLEPHALVRPILQRARNQVRGVISSQAHG